MSPQTARKGDIDLPLNEKLLLTYAEAAAYLGVGQRTVEHLVASGQLECKRIKAGGRGSWLRRITREALEKYVTQ